MNYTEELSRYFIKTYWEKANRRLVAKMLQEFMYEDMIDPVEQASTQGRNVYTFSPYSGTLYTFEAVERLFDSYSVDSKTISKYQEDEEAPLNAIEFLLELQDYIGMNSMTTGHLIKEYQQTLIADCYLLEKNTPSEELLKMDYAEAEGELSGHPWITYNKGRVGFHYGDYLNYAPEQQKEVTLYWVAVHKEEAVVSSIKEIDFESFIKRELGPFGWKEMNEKLKEEAGEEQAGEYVFMPVHEWQWENVLIQQFAEALVYKKIIPLGRGKDFYLPQQSIRTFVNVSEKEKHHVKLPISILNTLVYRGLPGERTMIAPKVTTFIKDIKQNDSFLSKECKLGLLGEEVSIHVPHSAFEKVNGVPYQYKEQFGVIWRESIYGAISESEKPMSLASLLYEPDHGQALVSKLIEQSGITAEEWVKQLCQAILPPLLHYLYQYGVVFSPHGQNAIIVLENDKPKRLVMKDFVDDVNISDQPFEELKSLSPELKKVLRSESPEGLTQFIFTGLFICHFRYLADLLDRKNELDESLFWKIVRGEIKRYQARFPELKKRFDTFDFFKEKMTKLCLNRNRMIDYGYEESEDRPHASEFGKVNNGLVRQEGYQQK
ncbi:IucA/IucC family protein [Bacillus sp. FJAT-44742]|uniref:IucA/IucC family protein n=1 Tax=Bacillus sp. FJAT-44742 TaxID=2014005 RepID=UPI000C2337A9|nr:IucA/IucC family siderophore biosynthesis protein [Bacillus sp. FJAT-44742]